jgi:KaiC/GvpD/RAD55 family RecA-like ATPase
MITELYNLDSNIYNKNKITLISGEFYTYKTMLSLHLYKELIKSDKKVLFISKYRTNLIAKKIAKLELQDEVMDTQKAIEIFNNTNGRLLQIGNVTKDKLIEKLNKELKFDYDLIIIDFDTLSTSNNFNIDDLIDINNSVKNQILFVKDNVTYDKYDNINLITLNKINKQYFKVYYNGDLISILNIGESALEPTFINDDLSITFF